MARFFPAAPRSPAPGLAAPHAATGKMPATGSETCVSIAFPGQG